MLECFYSHKMDHSGRRAPLGYEFVANPVNGSEMNRLGWISFKFLA
jgi:hypothetical protein